MRGSHRRGFTVERYAVHSSFTLPADPDLIPAVVEAVVGVVAHSRVPLVEASAVALVVQEALTNAVVHGCGKDRSKQVQCDIGCDPGLGLLVLVRDPGPGFDTDAVAAELEGASRSGDHGRGIYLIRRLMDDVDFARNGAEIRIRKFPVAGMKAVA